MKKRIAICFLSIYFLSATELHELIKLPVLLRHFWEHRQTDKALSFSDFIFLHYGSDSHSDAHHEQDTSLPFKSHPEGACAASIPAILPDFLDFKLQPAFQFYTQSRLMKDSFFQSALGASIWQPPKNC